MPTIDRVRELCARVIAAESGSELDVLLLELQNAIDVYQAIENENGQRSAASEPPSPPVPERLTGEI